MFLSILGTCLKRLFRCIPKARDTNWNSRFWRCFGKLGSTTSFSLHILWIWFFLWSPNETLIVQGQFSSYRKYLDIGQVCRYTRFHELSSPFSRGIHCILLLDLNIWIELTSSWEWILWTCNACLEYPYGMWNMSSFRPFLCSLGKCHEIEDICTIVVYQLLDHLCIFRISSRSIFDSILL